MAHVKYNILKLVGVYIKRCVSQPYVGITFRKSDFYCSVCRYSPVNAVDNRPAVVTAVGKSPLYRRIFCPEGGKNSIRIKRYGGYLFSGFGIAPAGESISASLRLAVFGKVNFGIRRNGIYIGRTAVIACKKRKGSRRNKSYVVKLKPVLSVGRRERFKRIYAERRNGAVPVSAI